MVEDLYTALNNSEPSRQESEAHRLLDWSGEIRQYFDSILSTYENSLSDANGVALCKVGLSSLLHKAEEQSTKASQVSFEPGELVSSQSSITEGYIYDGTWCTFDVPLIEESASMHIDGKKYAVSDRPDKSFFRFEVCLTDSHSNLRVNTERLEETVARQRVIVKYMVDAKNGNRVQSQKFIEEVREFSRALSDRLIASLDLTLYHRSTLLKQDGIPETPTIPVAMNIKVYGNRLVLSSGHNMVSKKIIYFDDNHTLLEMSTLLTEIHCKIHDLMTQRPRGSHDILIRYR